ncbi:phosphoribosylamine--glycine ligase [Thermoleophilum album]|uniref:phosphoribosylamine--glycine ligase n=1 Tax=Thermoleophilum album TaxID=29539 RepID=UPI000B832AFF|nr:phosphoribosylamine--glycine ligase [Thermoleophilum album]
MASSQAPGGGAAALPRRVLVLGAGGREHALVRAISRSGARPTVWAAPGNPGIARDGARCVAIDPLDPDAVCELARRERIDFVVVGPEAPLVAGIADALAEAGVRCLGPSRAAARVEGSKADAKRLMEQAGVPTARYEILESHDAALARLPQLSYPAVFKADALAAGKGVIIAQDEDQARQALDAYFVERRFGETTVLLEEYLEGEELSLLCLCDGERALPLAPARDYKRLLDGDEGPNTGGMGSYSPVPEIGPDLLREIVATVHQPIVDALRAQGTPYHGVLYGGLMLTDAGVRVLEFNCRFGDPETQALLPRMASDLLELLWRASFPGGLADAECRFEELAAVCVVLAAAGYPESPRKGDVIEGVEAAEALGAEVFHAGTAVRDGQLVTAGGRVLNVVGLGDDLAIARQRAYAAADRIDFPGKQLRRDIAAGRG